MGEIQAIAGGLSAIKNALDIAKILKDIDKSVGEAEYKIRLVELSEKLLEAKENILQAQEENLALRSRLLEVEQQAQKKLLMTFKAPYYYQESDGVPFCPMCWESQGKAIHLINTSVRNSVFLVCPACGFENNKPPTASSGTLLRG